MIRIESNGFTLLCEEIEDGKMILKGYEGSDAVLDLSELAGVCQIDRKAFLSCKSLKKVILPASIEYVGDWAFSKCTNLTGFVVNGDFNKAIFARGVFEGCDALSEISFSNLDEHCGYMLAMNANRLANDILLRSDDLGEKSWYDKWDMALLALLNTDDAEGSTKAALCGEEDISYDGVGMVDGEMPGETEDFIKNAAKNKCLLTYFRLKYDSCLDTSTKDKLFNYIAERSFENKNSVAWLTLKEECATDMEFWQMYLDIVKPDKDDMDKMIADLNSTQVQAKAFLIGAAGNTTGGDDFFDDLLL